MNAKGMGSGLRDRYGEVRLASDICNRCGSVIYCTEGMYLAAEPLSMPRRAMLMQRTALVAPQHGVILSHQRFDFVQWNAMTSNTFRRKSHRFSHPSTPPFVSRVGFVYHQPPEIIPQNLIRRAVGSSTRRFPSSAVGSLS